MNKEYYISHPQDLKDAIDDLKELRLPFMLLAKSTAPTKEHVDEYEKKRKQMAYLFRSVVPAYADCTGVTEEQARGELQIKFARCGEIIKDSSGEYDIVWLDGDKFRVLEQGKIFQVQSIASMSNAELSGTIEKSKNYILQQFGVIIKEFINIFKTKEI
jgi:hypothetical protein